MTLPLVLWLVLVFLLGSAVGSFLNVCVDRLPREKSVLWPGSHCGSCLRPIRAYDNIPLVSYWLLRGRCRQCGAAFSSRCFWVELFTGLGFAALFYLLVVANVRQFAVLDRLGGQLAGGMIPWQGWVVFGHGAVLFSFLLAAALCDLEYEEIPLSLTVPGTLLGLGAAALWPWPWPYSLTESLAHVNASQPWWLINPRVGPKSGLYPWPIWGPWPDWLPPGTWYSGLATGLAGMLAGSLLVRAIDLLFTQGMGKEAVARSIKGAGRSEPLDAQDLGAARAIGLGDADLMMLAGAFVGWQAVVLAFFVAVVPGLVFGIASMLFRQGRAFPFGPSLAVGVLLTVLGWEWLRPRVQPLFFWGPVVLLAAILSAMFLFAAALLLRKLRT